MARETYSGGAMLSSATAMPSVVMTGVRLRVRYAPSGPRASMAIRSVPSETISVDAFDDRLTLEGGNGPHLADRIAHLAWESRHPDGTVAFQIVREEHPLADVIHHHLPALAVRHFVAAIGIYYPEGCIWAARVEDERVVVAAAGDRLGKNHRAAERHRDCRLREDPAQQIQRVDVYIRATEQHEADLLVHQIDHVVVAGHGLEQRRSGMQVRDVLGLQDVDGLLDEMVDIGRHLRGGVAGSDPLDPSRVQIDGVKGRAEALGDQAREVAHTVRPARHHAQEATAGQEAAAGEILGLPFDDLGDPIRQLDSPFRRTGGTTGFEDLWHWWRRFPGDIAARNQVFDGLGS